MRSITPERLLKDVGRRIGELRAARGLTQEQLAERLDASARWVQSVEGGTENITLGTLTTFANALRAPVLELFKPPTTVKPKPGRPKSPRRHR